MTAPRAIAGIKRVEGPELLELSVDTPAAIPDARMVQPAAKRLKSDNAQAISPPPAPAAAAPVPQSAAQAADAVRAKEGDLIESFYLLFENISRGSIPVNIAKIKEHSIFKQQLADEKKISLAGVFNLSKKLLNLLDNQLKTNTRMYPFDIVMQVLEKVFNNKAFNNALKDPILSYLFERFYKVLSFKLNTNDGIKNKESYNAALFVLKTFYEKGKKDILDSKYIESLSISEKTANFRKFLVDACVEPPLDEKLAAAVNQLNGHGLQYNIGKHPQLIKAREGKITPEQAYQVFAFFVRFSATGRYLQALAENPDFIDYFAMLPLEKQASHLDRLLDINAADERTNDLSIYFNCFDFTILEAKFIEINTQLVAEKEKSRYRFLLVKLHVLKIILNKFEIDFTVDRAEVLPVRLIEALNGKQSNPMNRQVEEILENPGFLKYCTSPDLKDACIDLFTKVFEFKRVHVLPILAKLTENPALVKFFRNMSIEEKIKWAEKFFKIFGASAVHQESCATILRCLGLEVLEILLGKLSLDRSKFKIQTLEYIHLTTQIKTLRAAKIRAEAHAVSSVGVDTLLAVCIEALKAKSSALMVKQVERVLQNPIFIKYCTLREFKDDCIRVFKQIVGFKKRHNVTVLAKLTENPMLVAFYQAQSVEEKEKLAEELLEMSPVNNNRPDNYYQSLAVVFSRCLGWEMVNSTLKKVKSKRSTVSTSSSEYASLSVKVKILKRAQEDAEKRRVAVQIVPSAPAAAAAADAVEAEEKPKADTASPVAMELSANCVAYSSHAKLAQQLRAERGAPAAKAAVEEHEELVAKAVERANLDAYRYVKCPGDDDPCFNEVKNETDFAVYLQAYKVQFEKRKEQLKLYLQEKMRRDANDPIYKKYREKFENFPAAAIIVDHKNYTEDLKNLLGITYKADDSEYKTQRGKLAIVPDEAGTGQWKVIALEDIHFRKNALEAERILCRYTGKDCNAKDYKDNPLSRFYTVSYQNVKIEDSTEGDVAGRMNHFDRPIAKYWVDDHYRIFVVARKHITKIPAGRQIGCWYPDVLGLGHKRVKISTMDGLKVRKFAQVLGGQVTQRAAAAAAAAAMPMQMDAVHQPPRQGLVMAC